LRREVLLSPEVPLDATLRGALSAVCVEVARRTRAALPLRALEQTQGLDSAVYVDATLLLDGCPYGVTLCLSAEPRPAIAPEVATLGELLLRVPLVIACSAVSRAEFAALTPGCVWLPGNCSINADLVGSALLCAGTLERGCAVELRAGKIVLRGETRNLALDSEPDMADNPGAHSDALNQTLLEAPLVVRVELGAVQMTAREWSELQAGDVIETGRRIGELAVLRVAGREVARGELVSIDGELGIRIRELVTSK
jgi:flagellar motor switch/type III secretory pathway protein FliN